MRITESIVRDENSILTVSTLVRSHYGIDGVCLGVPAILGDGGVKKMLDISLSEEERKNLEKSANIIKSELEASAPTLV